MNIDWFIPHRLAGRLVRGQVPNREVAMIMVFNLLFGTVVSYGAFTWASPPWTLLSLVEFATVVVVTLIGFTKCYDAAGGDANGDFAKQFNCLSFGVWFWVTLVVWAIYWIVVALLRQHTMAAYEVGDTGTVEFLTAFGGGIEDLWTIAAAVAWQIGFFAWLRSGLAAARGGA